MATGDVAAELTMSAAHRRAEIRRRKLISNSEQRMNRIMGIHKPASSVDDCQMKPPADCLLGQTSSDKRGAIVVGHNGASSHQQWSSSDDAVKEDASGLRKRTDLAETKQYISRYDDAMKLRKQLDNEKTSPEDGRRAEEFDAFRLLRLAGSVTLALIVRLFVCEYLSIFAPFLTLQLAFMGLSRYFPKGEKKTKTTVLTTALMLSGIPSEVISRSLDTYGKMVDVFTDLCVYFFTFIFCHELFLYFGIIDP